MKTVHTYETFDVYLDELPVKPGPEGTEGKATANAVERLRQVAATIRSNPALRAGWHGIVVSDHNPQHIRQTLKKRFGAAGWEFRIIAQPGSDPVVYGLWARFVGKPAPPEPVTTMPVQTTTANPAPMSVQVNGGSPPQPAHPLAGMGWRNDPSDMPPPVPVSDPTRAPTTAAAQTYQPRWGL